jgi:hypothetical protein
MTYNHAKYIKDAMDGFCMQQTDFPFVCGIIDDASTDGEQELIQKYVEVNFDLRNNEYYRREDTDDYVRIFIQHKKNKNCFFVVIYLKKNHYSLKKTKLTYVSKWRENAKYIAHCEGDDYWIDSQKLQKQVNFLESHTDYGLVYSKARICNIQNGNDKKIIGNIIKSYESLLIKNSIPTLTVLYRYNSIINYNSEITPFSFKWKMGDYPRWLYIALRNKIFFLKEITSVYRIHEGSASRPRDYNSKIKYIESIRDIRLFFLKQYNNQNNDLYKKINNLYIQDCMIIMIKNHNYKKSFYWINDSTCDLFFKILLYVKFFYYILRVS